MKLYNFIYTVKLAGNVDEIFITLASYLVLILEKLDKMNSDRFFKFVNISFSMI